MEFRGFFEGIFFEVLKFLNKGEIFLKFVVIVDFIIIGDFWFDFVICIVMIELI